MTTPLQQARMKRLHAELTEAGMLTTANAGKKAGLSTPEALRMLRKMEREGLVIGTLVNNDGRTKVVWTLKG